MTKLDGSTTGTKSFTGEICKQLFNCEELPVVYYDPIECEVINYDSSLLSSDQKYMLEIYNAVSSSFCSESLKERDPGNILHSRWLTTANRLLRLYISTLQVSENFHLIVMFIIKVHIPM